TIVTRGEQLQDDKRASLAVAGAFAAAVLLHQAAILIGFALTAYFFASRSWRDAWRALLRIAIYSGGIVLIAYLAAFVAIYGAHSCPRVAGSGGFFAARPRSAYSGDASGCGRPDTSARRGVCRQKFRRWHRAAAFVARQEIRASKSAGSSRAKAMHSCRGRPG